MRLENLKTGPRIFFHIVILSGVLASSLYAEINWAHLRYGSSSDYYKRYGSELLKDSSVFIDGNKSRAAKYGTYCGQGDTVTINFGKKRQINKVVVYNAFASRSGAKKLDFLCEDGKTWVLLGNVPEGELNNTFEFEPVSTEKIRITILSQQKELNRSFQSVITEIEAINTVVEAETAREVSAFQKAEVALKKGIGEWAFSEGWYVANKTEQDGILAGKTAMADSVTETTIEMPSGDSFREAGLLFRFQDENNYCAFLLRNSGAKTKLWLVKSSGGIWGILQKEEIERENTSALYNLKVMTTGKTIRCFLDGQKIIEVETGDIIRGAAGVRTTAEGAKFKEISQQEIESDARSEIFKQEIKKKTADRRKELHRLSSLLEGYRLPPVFNAGLQDKVDSLALKTDNLELSFVSGVVDSALLTENVFLEFSGKLQQLNSELERLKEIVEDAPEYVGFLENATGGKIGEETCFIGTETSLMKVYGNIGGFHGDMSKDVMISAARNEYESFQIVFFLCKISAIYRWN